MKFGKPPSQIPPALLPLPPLGERPAGAFWRPNPAFIKELGQALAGQRVLEIFAGNGLLAGHLAARGIDVTATSILSSMDAHTQGLYHPVKELGAREAVARHGADHDILLLCWPTVTESALLACRDFGAKPILFIGEFTDYSKNHLGGCASDAFFQDFRISREFSTYQGNMLEKACLGRISALKRE